MWNYFQDWGFLIQPIDFVTVCLSIKIRHKPFFPLCFAWPHRAVLERERQWKRTIKKVKMAYLKALGKYFGEKPTYM